mmetsp:Transcript_44306/g.118225  ORF Transcript_44306/g.118225 Transcript_44306/m.118225 type:complete len:220 (-) Transcript_44306:127-786(-)
MHVDHDRGHTVAVLLPAALSYFPPQPLKMQLPPANHDYSIPPTRQMVGRYHRGHKQARRVHPQSPPVPTEDIDATTSNGLQDQDPRQKAPQLGKRPLDIVFQLQRQHSLEALPQAGARGHPPNPRRPLLHRRHRIPLAKQSLNPCLLQGLAQWVCCCRSLLDQVVDWEQDMQRLQFCHRSPGKSSLSFGVHHWHQMTSRRAREACYKVLLWLQSLLLRA